MPEAQKFRHVIVHWDGTGKFQSIWCDGKELRELPPGIEPPTELDLNGKTKFTKCTQSYNVVVKSFQDGAVAPQIPNPHGAK